MQLSRIIFLPYFLPLCSFRTNKRLCAHPGSHSFFRGKDGARYLSHHSFPFWCVKNDMNTLRRRCTFAAFHPPVLRNSVNQQSDANESAEIKPKRAHYAKVGCSECVPGPDSIFRQLFPLRLWHSSVKPLKSALQNTFSSPAAPFALVLSGPFIRCDC